MNMETLKQIKETRCGTKTETEQIEETRKMLETSKDNLNEVIEVMELLDLDIEIGNKIQMLKKHGVSETRCFKKLNVDKEDEEIYRRYVKYSSSVEWNEFCLEQLGEL